MKTEKNTTRHKLAFLTWIVIYPLISGILFLFKEVLFELPLFARTFVLTVVLISLMQYVITPFVTKKFQFWITNTKEQKK
ncbi:MAG: hypothetical protein AAF611_19680 [Bacteroidota bacterium]